MKLDVPAHSILHTNFTATSCKLLPGTAEWSPALTVDVWRSEVGVDLLPVVIAGAKEPDSFTDALGKKVRGTFLYFVCETGNDQNCSDLFTAEF